MPRLFAQACTERSECVATSSFPSLTLTFATPAGAGGTGLLRSTKSSHENRRGRVACLRRGGGQVEAQRIGIVLA